jgi:hypothetical protein
LPFGIKMRVANIMVARDTHPTQALLVEATDRVFETFVIAMAFPGQIPKDNHGFFPVHFLGELIPVFGQGWFGFLPVGVGDKTDFKGAMFGEGLEEIILGIHGSNIGASCRIRQGLLGPLWGNFIIY